MLIIALVLAVIALAALVFAVVTSNALVAWVCIGASLLGVVLLIVDALQERRRRGVAPVDESAGAEPATEAPEVSGSQDGKQDATGVEAVDVPYEADEADEADTVDSDDESAAGDDESAAGDDESAAGDDESAAGDDDGAEALSDDPKTL
jgi:hypothetical protein